MAKQTGKLRLTADLKRRRKLKLKAPAAKEWHEQRTVFEWAKLNEGREPRLALLNGSMNGLQVSNPAIIVRAKLCGLKTGFLDINLPVRGYASCPGLYVEQKRKHSKWETCGWDCASDDQLWWRDRLREQGYQVEVSHRSEDTTAYLRTYLDMEES